MRRFVENSFQKYALIGSVSKTYTDFSFSFSGSARGGSGIPVYPKKIRQNTQKYPKFLPIYPQLIEGLNTVDPKLVVAKQALILFKSYLYITPPTRNRRASFVHHLIENWQSVNPHWGRTVITFSR